MNIITPALIKKKEQFNSIYMNLHQSIRAHGVHVGVVAGVMARHCKEQLSEQYDLLENSLEITIIRGGDYHDIGKHFISYALCQKTGPLSKMEEKAVRQHPDYTGNLLLEYAEVLFDTEGAKNIALDMGRYHHEHYDGSGYPMRLKGDKIPFIAQLCAVANTLDKATMNSRRYVDFKIAAEKIFADEGIRFSPEAVECFKQSMDEIKTLYTAKNSWIVAGAKGVRRGKTK